MNVTVTPVAADRVRRAAEEGGSQGMPLRVAAKRGADGTIEYGMGFDEPLDTDTRVVTNGIEVVVAPTSAPLLDGLVLDFVRLDDGDEQFVFLNPNDASEG